MTIDQPPRSGWIRYAILTVLTAGGLTAGLLLSNAFDAPTSIPQGDTPTHPPPAASLGQPRFPLSALDAKDQMEAPELAADATGRVFLTWASQSSASERRLYLSHSDDEGRTFAAPREITRTGIVESVAQMKGKTIKRAIRMMPHLAARDNVLHLAWTEAMPGNTSVRTVVAESTDGGKSFAPASPVHQGPNARTTFTALSAGPEGTVVCSWLDNRNRSQQCFASIRKPGRTDFEEETIVHAGDERGVCPCCPTANLVAPDGSVYVAFRNVDDGHRDIAVGVLKPGASKFAGPFPVVPPTWKFNGCPHDGPSMAIVGTRLHIVWMDARSGSPRCYHARAELSEMRFTSEELHAIPIGTQGNAKLHADRTGGLHVVWEESSAAPPAGAGGKHQHGPAVPKLGSGGRAIQYAKLGADGRFGPARAVAPRVGAFQTRPTLTSTSTGNIVVAWNELDEDGKAVVVRPAPPGEQVARGSLP